MGICPQLLGLNLIFVKVYECCGQCIVLHVIQYRGSCREMGHKMFLKKAPQKNAHVKLALCESYRVGKKTKQRQVRSLGYLDELEQNHADPIARGRTVALQKTQEKKQAVPFEIHPLEKIDKKGQNRKNLGCTIALAV